MEFSISDIWQHMGIPALMVAVVLLIMGLASLTVFVERLLTLQRSRTASKEFSAQVASDLNAGHYDAVIAEAEAHTRGHLTRIVRTGLQTYRHAEADADVLGLPPVEQTRRHMERYMDEISADLRRGLSVLASVGSTAPFIGLLGTVLGIISAFQGIAATGSGGLSSVSAGISEALIETALGLTVAIPAVLVFNYLSTKIAREELSLRNACGALLDTIEDRAERQLATDGSRGGAQKVRAAKAEGATRRDSSTRESIAIATNGALA